MEGQRRAGGGGRGDGGRSPGEAAPAPVTRAPLGGPVLGFPRSAWCATCARSTTHVQSGCTRCMGRADNRKQGALFVVVGAALLALGWVASGMPALIVLVLGGTLVAKGAHAVAWGSDPEAP